MSEMNQIRSPSKQKFQMSKQTDGQFPLIAFKDLIECSQSIGRENGSRRRIQIARCRRK